MREIKFRAKRVDNGKWAYGSYLAHKEYMECVCSGKPAPIRHLILYDGFADWNMPITIEYCEVDPNTVGQGTGLCDADGVPIFDGDILQFGDKRLLVWWNGESFQWQARSILSYDVITHDDTHPFSEWNNIDLGWIAAEPICTGRMTTLIIGNIYDNPELLEGDR